VTAIAVTTVAIAVAAVSVTVHIYLHQSRVCGLLRAYKRTASVTVTQNSYKPPITIPIKSRHIKTTNRPKVGPKVTDMSL
ncbi:MAG TPA: hypothetical protein VH414_21360, partial [Lichenihabitans sp.]|nr:hypothetical protein [Lichenihabitans sp.]